MRRLLCLTILVVSLGAPQARAESPSPWPPGSSRVSYRAPVDAPITDHFRKPEQNWKSGNRGIDYATTPGTPVRAAADGEVTFAGQVGGTQHVVILHADGLRTSYSFLTSAAVKRGDRVKQGDVVGAGGPSLHFGVRKPDDTYIDPESLLNGSDEVHLVPETERRARTEHDERAGIVRLLGALARPARATAAAVEWAARQGVQTLTPPAAFASLRIADLSNELRGIAHYAAALQPCFELLSVVRGIKAWDEQRDRCTPPSVLPPKLTARHRVVLVGGLGSASGHAAILGVPTDRLGYDPSDVMQFSYRGGTTKDATYEPADTTVDIRRSGRRLRELLERLAAEQPGVPIDVIAHSQGGLVTRAALGDELDAGDSHRPPLGAIITLGTPHKGADLATAAAMLGHSPAGRSLLAAGAEAAGSPLNPRAPSLRQLSETSGFIRRLNNRPVPSDVRLTSIGARGDLVVPAPRARVAGAANVTVSVPGLARDHDGLPRSPEAEREIALALAGLPPTCETLPETLADTLIGADVGRAEDVLGATLWAGGRAFSQSSPGGT